MRELVALPADVPTVRSTARTDQAKRELASSGASRAQNMVLERTHK
jgi:hypothetical protein